MSGENIQIQTENSAPKKKKKHKKEKTEALGSWDLGGASTSNLSNTSATPIRNPVFSKVSENDTGMSVEGSLKKKKKKKNKEKDKEKEMANLRAIKRESADKTNVTTQSSPSKKSKYDDDKSFNASSYYVDTTTIEHKKSKKKKKNKKKDD